MSLNKPIHSIEEADLQRMVDEKNAESRRIDYKTAINFDTDEAKDKEEAKAEFRRDVSSFANSIGGDIIIGIRDNKGIPEELCGFELGKQSEEQFTQRLTEILQSRVKPRIRGVTIRPIRLSNNRWAAIIRIPNSYAKPHEVEVGTKGFEFWIRVDGMKQRMDVDELRDTFLLSESFADRARNHRMERVRAVKEGQAPVRLNLGAKTMLHFIPLDAFRSGNSYDLRAAEIELHPINQRDNWPRYYGSASHYNFEGVVVSNRNFSNDGEIPSNTYVQFSRNGIVEAVEGYRFQQEEHIIPIYHFHETLLESMVKFPNIMQQMGIQPPIAIMLSLIGVKGFSLQYDRIHYAREPHKSIDRDDLLMPEVILEELSCDVSVIAVSVRPIFDMLWQACNFRGCPCYDEQGIWNPAGMGRRIPHVYM